jgi:hypothetical protein
MVSFMPPWSKHRRFNTQRHLGWLLMAWLLIPTAILAAGIIIQRATARLVNDVYMVDATIHYQFSQRAIEALANGIALTLIVEIEVRQRRAYLWDPKVATISQRFRLEHHALSKQYVVTNLITDMRRNFPSLDEAIAILGKIEGVPIIEQRLLNPDRSYQARIRARLDIEALPALLQPIAYFSSDWYLSSPWYTWEIKP